MSFIGHGIPVNRADGSDKINGEWNAPQAPDSIIINNRIANELQIESLVAILLHEMTHMVWPVRAQDSYYFDWGKGEKMETAVFENIQKQRDLNKRSVKCCDNKKQEISRFDGDAWNDILCKCHVSVCRKCPDGLIQVEPE